MSKSKFKEIIKFTVHRKDGKGEMTDALRLSFIERNVALDALFALRERGYDVDFPEYGEKLFRSVDDTIESVEGCLGKVGS